VSGGRRTLFLVDGAIACVLGAGLLLLPDQLLLLFGLKVSAAVSVLMRLLGAAILSHGTIQVLARDHAEGPAGTAMIRGQLVFDFVGLGLSAYAAGSGLVSPLGWALAAVFAASAAARLLLLPGAAGSPS
jgi:hypothetical protein